MITVLWILIAQGILGALDVLINHEWCEDLAHRPSAIVEEAIHGVREILYAVIFAGLAWFTWHGSFAWLFAVVLLIEILLTAWDFVEEDRTRTLSATERVMHLVLSMGGGAYCALLLPILLGWSQQPSALMRVDYGFISWILTLMSCGVFMWGIRDCYASMCLKQLQNKRKIRSSTLQGSL